jgi:5-methylcytosine-specific restriction endonuclease McrA
MAKTKKKKPAKKKQKKTRVKLVPVDGLGPKELKQISIALRKTWSWSKARRIAKERAVDKDGFPVCEKCKKRVPSTTVDHITPIGDLRRPDLLAAMWCPSARLQALCGPCHRAKTKIDNAATAAAKADDDMGF